MSIRKSRSRRTNTQRCKNLQVERLEHRRLLAGDLELVKDINSIVSAANSSSPQQTVLVGSTAYFLAVTADHGQELWKSDGTAAGTVLVKDIRVGNYGSSITSLTNVNGVLYFTAADPAIGQELWKSNGTAAGTVLVKDIVAGVSSSSPSRLTNVGGTLYFTATDSTGRELWKSDGTDAGTVQIKDIFVGGGSGYPRYLVDVSGMLYFTANDGSSGIELWKSDGTAGGTTRVKDIVSAVGSSNPRTLTNVSGSLYFSANDGTSGYELWRSDGSDTGTTLVKDVFTGAGNSSSPSQLTNVNGKLFFTANDATNGLELWKSDGTETGTTLVKDILSGVTGSGVTNLTAVGSTLYFRANDGASGSELWKSDGTNGGTSIVKNIASLVGSSNPRYLTNLNGTLYFNANDNITGYELWRSDGTDTGTTPVADIFPGSSSFPTSLANLNGNLLFAAAGPSPLGNELWISDGTGPGTALVKDIYKTTSSSSPRDGSNVNGTLYFSATDGLSGYELWKSNGTESGTLQVLDINSGSSSSSPNYITDVGGTAFFSASTASSGAELWKSDGTPAGTTLVKEIVSGTGGANPVRLTNVGGTLYFAATDTANGTELWKSDGTSAGTVLVKDITPGTSSSSINYLTNVGGVLYFSANSRLWKSDGTAAGTVTLGTVTSPQKLMQSKGLLFFSGTSSAGQELWKSDGTELGTQLIRDIYPGSSSMATSSSFQFVDVAGTVYFNARDPVNGFELWKTDGTFAGTQLVKDIYTGGNGSYPRYLTNVSGTLFFRANFGNSGYELWKSDGSAEGTVQVKEINTNSSSSPSYLTNVAGTLYFTAVDDVSGFELWKSDGTSDGTVLVTDLRPGGFSSSPQPLRTFDPRKSFVEAGKKLYVKATTSAYGTELFAVDATGPNVLLGKTIFDYVGNSDLTLRKNGSKLELVETPAGIVVAAGELSSLDTLTINSAPSITINYSTGGLFSLPGGVRVNAKAGSSNSLTITGTGTSQAAYSTTTSPPGATQVVITEGGVSSTVRYGDFEVLRFDNMLTFGGSSALEIGTGSVTIGSVVAASLPFLTTLTGGTLAASSVALGSGEAIIGSGNVNARFSGELGSLIQLTGDMTVGNAVSAAGVNTRGDVLVNSHTLTLLDSNQAVLGSLTSLGTSTATGTVFAANGALIDFGNNLVGYGTLHTPNIASKPTMINGSVEGTSITNPVILSGFIKGVGTLNNVSITGTYSPGFSPAAVELGSVSYASSSVTVVELGGTTPGLQHDQLNHVGQALLGGMLDIDLINGYEPMLGASFTILTATGGVSGVFSSVELPPLTSGLEWQISYGSNSVIATVQQINFAPTDLSLSNSTIAENRPASTPVGSFTTVDANSGETFTYSLVSGNGSDDNGAFTVVGSQLIANGSFNFESKNSYAIRVRTADSGGLSLEKELTITVENVLEMPSPVQIGDGTTQRSVVNKLVVSFDQAIEFDAGAFQVFQRVKDSNNALVLVPVTTNVTVAATAGGMTATLTFSGSMTRAGTNALVDGNYQLTINGGLIRILNTTKTFDADGDGNGGGLYTLGTQSTDNFFALLGDANGNGEVDAQDLLGAKLALRKTVGQAGYNSAFDINGNGVVDAQDILNIQLNLRKKRVFF